MAKRGRPKLAKREKRAVNVSLKLTEGERELFGRVAEAMGRELTLPASALGVSAAIRMLMTREAKRLGVEE